MANPIRAKRRAAGGAAGAPASLLTTEIAYNEQDDIFYIGYGDNGSGVATSIRAFAGFGAAVGLTGNQTIAGVKTFSSTPVVPDQAYGAGWNGNNEVPTKNAVYDQIESVSAAGVSDGDKGDITVSGSGAAWTVDNDVVTNAKLANMATKTYKGRTSGSTGDPEDVAVATLKTDLGLVKGDVGLGNVDNTSDAGKPVSTAQQTALDLKANLAGPTFTGVPAAPTAAAATNTTQIATTAYVIAEIAARLASNDAMLYKGAINASSNPNYPAADAGFTYRFSVAGKIGGASGPNVQAGDMMICHVDSSAGGTHASVGADWDIIQLNIDGALTTSDIGSAVQAYNANLATIAGLAATTDNFIQSKGSAWASRTIAQVKTDLGLTGTNSGDQTSIVGITGTKAQFDTAVTDGDFLYTDSVIDGGTF